MTQDGGRPERVRDAFTEGDGVIGTGDVSGDAAPKRFIKLCRNLRHWPRETTVKAM